MNRAVFLDRDGVLTRALVRDGKAYAPVIPAEMEIDADAPAALSRLKAAGFLLVVVTNQPDVARGITRRGDVETMHATLRAALPLDAARESGTMVHWRCGQWRFRPTASGNQPVRKERSNDV